MKRKAGDLRLGSPWHLLDDQPLDSTTERQQWLGDLLLRHQTFEERSKSTSFRLSTNCFELLDVYGFLMEFYGIYHFRLLYCTFASHTLCLYL